MIIGITAADNNFAIGKNNDLLFHLEKDMKFFKETTTGHFVVMGENTLLSFPNSKPLKNRINVVLCPEEHEYYGCICFHDFSKMIKFIKCVAQVYDVYVVGGGMMYKSMLPYYDKVLVNKVDATVQDAEVFFPNLDKDSNYIIESRGEVIEDGKYKTQLITYTNRKNIVVQEFRGKHYFLSNFYPCPVTYNGITFRNSEAAFQAQKCPEKAELFKDLDPAAAKALGKTVELRTDWESIKDSIMYDIVYAKFTQNNDLKDKLLATGPEKLLEGNRYHDTYWGVDLDTWQGKNKLGEILMAIRDQKDFKVGE